MLSDLSRHAAEKVKDTGIGRSRFGASIEEHRGDGFNKAALKGSKPDDDDDDDEEDWWIKRHKRMKKLLKEQVERDMKRDAARRSALQEEFTRQHYISSRRQHSFLTAGIPNAPGDPLPQNPASSMTAALAYETGDIFRAPSRALFNEAETLINTAFPFFSCTCKYGGCIRYMVCGQGTRPALPLKSM